MYVTLSYVVLSSHPVFSQYKATDRSYVKGDFMFRNPNVIEMVTKTHAVVQENLSRKLKVVVSNE